MNKNMNKKFNILTLVCLTIFCLVLCFSMFSINVENYEARADESDVVYQDYQFHGSDLYHLAAYRSTAGQQNWEDLNFLTVSFHTKSTWNRTTNKYDIKIEPVISNLHKTQDYILEENLQVYRGGNNKDIREMTMKEDFFSLFFCRNFGDKDFTNSGTPLLVWIQGDFNSNVLQVKIGSTTNVADIYPSDPNLSFPTPAYTNGVNHYSYIKYTDVNGNSITFTFVTSGYYGLNDRVYGIGDHAYDYEKGYQNGFNEGKKVSYNLSREEIISNTYGFDLVTVGIGAVFEAMDKPIFFGSVSLINILTLILMFALVIGLLKLIK